MSKKQSSIRRFVSVYPGKDTKVKLVTAKIKLATSTVTLVRHATVTLAYPPPPPPPPPSCEVRPIWIQLDKVTLSESVPLGIQSWKARIVITVFPPGIPQTTDIPNLIVPSNPDLSVYFHEDGPFCGLSCPGGTIRIQITVSDNPTGTHVGYLDTLIDYIPGLMPLPFVLWVPIDKGDATMWFVFSAVSMC